MPLPANYKIDDYKDQDFYVRLGLDSSSVATSVIEGNYRSIMDYWSGMRIIKEKEREVAEAHTALTEAKETLIDHARKRAYDDARLSRDASIVNVLLIGGPGAGKSAILGAIYDACLKPGVISPLSARFSKDTRKNVTQNLEALKKYCNPNIFRTDNDKSIPRIGNKSETDMRYNLILSKEGKDCLQLNFIDTAGEDLHNVLKPKPDGDSYLSYQIKKCSAAILVVDTPAFTYQDRLLQSGVDLARRRNMPENVEALVQDWIASNPEMPRILCIVPVKTETDLYDPLTGRKKQIVIREIINRTMKEFETTITLLEQTDNAVIVVAPVETCGCLSLDPSWPPETLSNCDYPAEQWGRITNCATPPNPKTYSPVDCELPLVFLLNFFLNLVEPENASIEEIIDKVKIPDDIGGPIRNFVDQLFGDKFRRGWNQVLTRIVPVLGMLDELFGGIFVRDDVKNAIRIIMRRSVRLDSVVITGKTDLITTF